MYSSLDFSGAGAWLPHEVDGASMAEEGDVAAEGQSAEGSGTRIIHRSELLGAVQLRQAGSFFGLGIMEKRGCGG